MAFEKGVSGNPEGRPKGSPNKVNIQVKEFIEDLLSDNSEDLKTEFKALKGRHKVKAFIDLLPYVVPKLQATSLDLDFERLSDDQVNELYERIINGIKK